MSTLKADTIQSTGGGAATLTQQAASKVFLLSNSGAAASASLNVSGMTDNGTGDYTTSFSSAFGSTNYAHCLSASKETGDVTVGTNIVSRLAGSLRNECARDDSTKTDSGSFCISMFGDLA